MRKNIAILLAGGVGSRLGAGRPKQFVEIAGQTVLEHTLNAFQRCAAIDEIAIVAHPEFADEVRNLLATARWPKAQRVLLGGKERYDSSLAALWAYEGEEVNFVFHDAVRPAVSVSLITAVCQALEKASAVNVTLPAIDTIIEVDGEGRMVGVPERSRLQRVQTPQGFRSETIAAAYERALQDPDFRGTDDCGVVFKYLPEVPITLVRGEERNLKLTYPEDLITLEHYLRQTL